MTGCFTTDLHELAGRIRNCRICSENPAGKPLPHAPRPVVQPSATARIMIAGQAPGTRVHGSGRPFTDPSGDRLRHWLGLSEHQFYNDRCLAIIPMGFCFPGLNASGSDLPPRRECAPTWRPALMAAMPQVELVVCLGAYAMAWHMGSLYPGSVDRAVRNWRSALDLRPAVLPLPHPSWRNSGWLKRNMWFEAELVPELRRRVQLLLPDVA